MHENKIVFIGKKSNISKSIWIKSGTCVLMEHVFSQNSDSNTWKIFWDCWKWSKNLVWKEIFISHFFLYGWQVQRIFEKWKIIQRRPRKLLEWIASTSCNTLHLLFSHGHGVNKFRLSSMLMDQLLPWLYRSTTKMNVNSQKTNFYNKFQYILEIQ